MELSAIYKSFSLEKDKKSYLKGYHVSIDTTDLFLNIDIVNYEFEAEAQSICDSILEIMQKHLQEAGDQPVYDRFEESLKEVNYFLTDLRNKKEPGDIGHINALIGVLENNTLHITKTGLAEAYLLRKGNIIEISEGLYNAKNSDTTYFINIASGALEKGDKVLFSNKRLLKFVPKGDINSIFLASDFESSILDLKGILGMEEVGDLFINGFVLDFIEQRSDDQPEVTGGHHRTAKTGGTFDTIRPYTDKAIDLSKKAGKWTKTFVTEFPEKVKDPEGRKVYIIAGVVIIVAILLLSVTFSSNSKNNNEQLQKYEVVLQNARDLLSQSRQQKLYDAKLAKTTLDQARKKAIEVQQSGVYYSDSVSMLKDIEQEGGSMDRSIRIENPTTLVQLNKKDVTIDAQHLVNLNDTFYVVTMDSVLGPIVDAAPDSYAKSTMDNGELIVSADKFLDRNDLVLLTKSNKIVEFKDNVYNYMDTEDTLWHGGLVIKTYSTRQYIYVLDPANNNIWRYERTNKKYKGAAPYNTDKIDIKDAVSFAIDGNVYILKKSGEIKKLYAQKSMPLTLEGGPNIPLANLDNRAKIYTSENMRNVYIMDPSNSRILVYKKVTFEKTDKLSYDRQFVFTGKDVRDFYVDDAEQNMYVLAPQQIYKVDLKAMQ